MEAFLDIFKQADPQNTGKEPYKVTSIYDSDYVGQTTAGAAYKTGPAIKNGGIQGTPANFQDWITDDGTWLRLVDSVALSAALPHKCQKVHGWVRFFS